MDGNTDMVLEGGAHVVASQFHGWGVESGLVLLVISAFPLRPEDTWFRLISVSVCIVMYRDEGSLRRRGSLWFVLTKAWPFGTHVCSLSLAFPYRPPQHIQSLLLRNNTHMKYQSFHRECLTRF